jgi:hypothetical protein
MPYIVFQYHTSFYSLVPTSFLVGVVGAPLGVAANKYLAVTAEVYSDISGTPIDVTIPRFFGFFLLMCQGAQVWGNLITSAGKFRSFKSRIVCVLNIIWNQKQLLKVSRCVSRHDLSFAHTAAASDYATRHIFNF